MTEDASLFDFDEGASDAGDGGERTADADTDGENTEGDAAPDAESDGGNAAVDADSATPTYRWSPDGAPCPDCGAASRRRWRDGDEFVCADCKDW